MDELLISDTGSDSVKVCSCVYVCAYVCLSSSVQLPSSLEQMVVISRLKYSSICLTGHLLGIAKLRVQSVTQTFNRIIRE